MDYTIGFGLFPYVMWGYSLSHGTCEFWFTILHGAACDLGIHELVAGYIRWLHPLGCRNFELQYMLLVKGHPCRAAADGILQFCMVLHVILEFTNWLLVTFAGYIPWVAGILSCSICSL
ncbi:unnamed protein product [Symbiodinium sp. CCMP2592]|nr:unnamed protein product [Symbiodinium sp. CCMP2592]